VENSQKLLLLLKMNKGIIITLPRHDYVTEYISQFSVNILKEANKKNIKVKTLKDKKANRDEFEEVLKNLDYKMIIFPPSSSTIFLLTISNLFLNQLLGIMLIPLVRISLIKGSFFLFSNSSSSIRIV